MILDIDPDPDLPWDAVVQAAMDARRLLSGLGLAAFAKTTGGKGLHVVVPLARRSNWEELRAFARALADALAKQRPDLYTANPLKAQRRGRIYIDYLRNAREATAIAAYSTRARPGAPVSTPVDWDELNAAKPGTLTLRTVPSRLQAPDPWAGYERTRQSITAAMKVAVGRL